MQSQQVLRLTLRLVQSSLRASNFGSMAQTNATRRSCSSRQEATHSIILSSGRFMQLLVANGLRTDNSFQPHIEVPCNLNREGFSSLRMIEHSRQATVVKAEIRTRAELSQIQWGLHTQRRETCMHQMPFTQAAAVQITQHNHRWRWEDAPTAA